MSYISAQLSQNRSQVLVWERNENNERVLSRYKTPLYFYIEDHNGKYISLYGKKLRKVTFDSYNEFYQTKQTLDDKGIKLYESDIRPEYKVLSEHYYNKAKLNLHISYLDIEVDYDPTTKGMATAENPYAPISAISIFHQYSGRKIVLAVPPKIKNWSDVDLDKLKTKAEIIICKNEKELLKLFLTEIYDSDCLSHWNGFNFDMPYLYERLKLIHGDAAANLLSFPEARPPQYKEAVNKFKIDYKKLLIHGRISLDYMELFIKFAPSALDSYSLESVAETELPDLPKLEHEGSLYQFYNNNFVGFVEYNIRDTEILEGLENKFGYIALAIEMAQSNTALIDDVLGTTKMTEMAIINYCHYDKNIIVPDSKKSSEIHGKFAGAFVLDTIPGMHEWVASLDVQSLYPSVMRSVNISPEKIVGQFIDKYMAFDHIKDRNEISLTLNYENGDVDTRPAKEWAEFINNNNWTLSGYGTIFNQDELGVIPSILTKWFEDRKTLKKKANEFKDVDEEKYKYYDRAQNIRKLALNSTYGACGNEFFKFFDIRLAESTTRSGKAVLNHIIRTIAEKIDGNYTYPSPSIIHGDTDSCYFTTHANDAEEALFVARYIQNAVNAAAERYTENEFFIEKSRANLIRVEQEIVSDIGIVVAKKNYVYHLIFKDGKKVKESDEIKLTGLQIKKSSIPKQIRKVLLDIITEFLKEKNWDKIATRLVNYREFLKDEDVIHIGLPKMVKNYEHYNTHYKNKTIGVTIPGHVKASIYWNRCLEKFNDNESFKIVSGTKTKIFYLKKENDGFKSIAMPVDVKIVPSWFKEIIYDMIDKEAQIERLIDSPFGAILKAIGKKMPTKKSMAIDEIFE